MLPAIVGMLGKRQVDEGSPLWTFRLADELHIGLVSEAITFPCIAGNTRAHNVLPCRLATSIAWKHVVEIQFLTIEDIATVLARVFVALEDIVAGELHFFFGHALKEE